MRYKIKEKPIVTEKMKFLFFSRYCQDCLTCFWLEKIPFEYTGGWWSPKGCPLCGGFLWSTKKSALLSDSNRKNI